MYKKRAGSSGISGALYETKLISLLYFRAIHDDDIEEFQLASNIDNIGAFDDICFKAKVKGFNKPVAVFIQVKHRGNEKQTLNFDLATYFNSYLKIRQQFHPRDTDLFFRGCKFDETECLFVLYTNAKIDFSDNSVGSGFSAKLKDLIDTRNMDQQQYKYEKNIEYRIISVEDQVISLAKRIAKLIMGKGDFRMMLTDEYVLRYHVILAQKVFVVSEIQPDGYRMAYFRNDFFDTNEEHLILFKDTLFKEILKRRTITPADIRMFLSEYLAEPTDVRRLSKLIGTVITYNNGQLEFDEKSTKDFRPDMKPMDVCRSTINEAVELAAKDILLSMDFKVPAAFGNKDLTIRGSDAKIEKRIYHLASRISELVHYCKPIKMVTINESLEKGFLQLYGGIAGAIGNIFVLDGDTKLMKITDNEESLGTLANRLYKILNSKIHNMHEYKFCFEVGMFPKLSFECMLIETRGTFKQSNIYEKNIEYLTKLTVIDHVTSLAKRMAKFIMGKEGFQMMLTDEYVLRYHVILAQKVFNVSEVQPDGYRMAYFRNDFFDTKEEFLILFKDTLFKEILKMRTIIPADIRMFLSEFIAEPTDARRLSKLIGTVITYNNGQLEFDKKSTKDFRPDMKPMDVSRSTINEAVELAAKDILPVTFKVAAAFGNKDLNIRGSFAKTEKRIYYLAWRIQDLLHNCKSSKMVAIEGEPMQDRFLQLNGGIASAIGNIFVLDDNTKLMKITDNCESLGSLAKSLYSKLNSEIHNLHDYKFCFKVDKFPKLSFGEYEKDLARDFLNKFLFYCNQADVNGVDEILKVEIGDCLLNRTNYFRVKTDALISKYYDEIMRWWMIPKVAPYLTRTNDLFRNVKNNIIKDPLMNSLSLTFMSKIENIDFTFTEDAVRSLNLQDQHSSTVIVAENSVLTVVKVMQHLKNKDHVVLDLEYIVNLPTSDRNALRSELTNTNEGRVLILVCDKIDSRNGMRTLVDITKAVGSKTTIIIITNQTSLQIINRYFPEADDIVHDKELSLADLSEDSQRIILEIATAILPGGEIKLKHLLWGWPKTGYRSVGTAVVASAGADKETGTGCHRIGDEEWNVPGKSQDPLPGSKSDSPPVSPRLAPPRAPTPPTPPPT